MWLVQDDYGQIQIEAIATFLIVFGTQMNIMLIIKVKIFVLDKRSCRSQPIMLIIEFRLIFMFWRCSPISFKHILLFLSSFQFLGWTMGGLPSMIWGTDFGTCTWAKLKDWYMCNSIGKQNHIVLMSPWSWVFSRLDLFSKPHIIFIFHDSLLFHMPNCQIMNEM